MYIPVTQQLQETDDLTAGSGQGAPLLAHPICAVWLGAWPTAGGY